MEAKLSSQKCRSAEDSIEIGVAKYDACSFLFIISDLFYALRAYSIRKDNISMLYNICFESIPAAFIIPHLLAPGAQRF